MTGSLWPSWRPTHPSWRSSRGRKAQPRLMPDPTNAQRGTHRPRAAGPVPRAWSTWLGWAGAPTSGAVEEEKERGAPELEPSAGAEPACSSGLPLAPSSLQRCGDSVSGWCEPLHELPSECRPPAVLPYQGRKEMGPHPGCCHPCLHRHQPGATQVSATPGQRKGPRTPMWCGKDRRFGWCVSGLTRRCRASMQFPGAFSQPEGASPSNFRPRGPWPCSCSHSWILAAVTLEGSDPPMGAGAGACALKSGHESNCVKRSVWTGWILPAHSDCWGAGRVWRGAASPWVWPSWPTGVPPPVWILVAPVKSPFPRSESKCVLWESKVIKSCHSSPGAVCRRQGRAGSKDAGQEQRTGLPSGLGVL